MVKRKTREGKAHQPAYDCTDFFLPANVSEIARSVVPEKLGVAPISDHGAITATMTSTSAERKLRQGNSGGDTYTWLAPIQAALTKITSTS